MDFYVIINSFEREFELNRLLSQIYWERPPNFGIIVQVYIDGGKNYAVCPEDSPNNTDFSCIHRAIDLRKTYVEHHGRENYYKLIRRGLEDANGEDFKYFLKIDDDMQLKPGFFRRIVEIWESIDDYKKITLNLLKDQRYHMWGKTPEVYNDELLLSHWVDLNFMGSVFTWWQLLKMEILPPTIETSSGVARQITRKFRESQFNMYQVRESMLVHGDHESKMNPTRKEKLTNL